MNKTVRSLAMTGVMLTAGLAFGTTPAMAASSASSAPSASAQAGTQAAKTPRSRIVRVYETRRGCERAGYRGEARGWWDYHRCTLIRRGPDRGDWLLRAFWDGRDHDNHGGNDHHGGGLGGNDHHGGGLGGNNGHGHGGNNGHGHGGNNGHGHGGNDHRGPGPDKK